MASSSQTAPPAPPLDPLASAIRHRLLLRDSLTFFSLTAITIVLFSATLFLFRSFAEHQHALAIRLSDRGRAELAAGHPEQAVSDLRTALTYAPGERTYELLLAQALGDAGHTEESFNYFTSLWDTQPGDGLINLRLARLSAAKREPEQAVNFYRAALYGTWPGDAIVRRQQTRLELAHYLLANHALPVARAELLIAASNAGQDSALEVQIAELLVQAGDPVDALAYSTKALADNPDNFAAANDSARLNYAMGHFAEARRGAERALQLAGTSRLRAVAQPGSASSTRPAAGFVPSTRTDLEPAALAQLQGIRADSSRILALTPAATLPPRERVSRILGDAALARGRLAACAMPAPAPGVATALPAGVAEGAPAGVAAGTGLATGLADLAARWAAAAATLNRGALLANPDLGDAAEDLIYTTEIATNGVCGSPTGDDALLLRLAQQHEQQQGAQPVDAQSAQQTAARPDVSPVPRQP